ncbi:MAG: 2Fe-2S iron-sulfur cluster binding domain-containing protein [Thioploca sp.]|nr:2Fe-2S iron-sulfur cluster binding domain-containing protein [Thioploca sp.]
MPQRLSLSRAARLVGVTRSTLQKSIQTGQLSTFEGKVTVTDLLRVYPETQMENTTLLERVERIKAEAVYEQWRSDTTTLPHPEVLMARLTNLSKELVSTKNELKKYLELIETLWQKITELEQVNDVQLRSHCHALYEWLVSEKQSHSQIINEAVIQLLAKDTVLRIMAAHVKLIPSEHEFFIEGNASILEAALQAGIALNYGCSSGNCGLCKARVVAGEVQKIRQHDYVISEAEKLMGYKLMCAHTAITDLIIEADEAHHVTDIPLQQIEAKVKKLEPVTPELLILYLQTPRTKTLRFFAGQMVTLHLESGLSGHYFIASCPCDGRNLEFHIAADNSFIEPAFQQLKPGQSINIEGPKGDFVLPEDSTRPALFIAYSHGFAPIKGLLEHAFALDTIAAFHLYWLANHENGFYQNNLCRAWADALDSFQYTPIIATRDELSLKQAFSSIWLEYPDLSQFEVYIAGPEWFITVVKEQLQQHPLPTTQLHSAAIA